MRSDSSGHAGEDGGPANWEDEDLVRTTVAAWLRIDEDSRNQRTAGEGYGA